MQKLSIAFLAAVSLASFGCKKKGGGGAGDMIEMQAKTRDAMCKCKDKACADKAQADMMAAATEMSKNMTEDDAKKMAAGVSAEDTKKMTDIAMETAKCQAAAMGGGDMAKPADGSAAAKPADGSAAAPAAGSGSAAAAAPAAGGGGDLPAECNDYKAAMEKLATCDKMPQASKDALKQGYDAMSSSWANVGSLPADAKAAMASGCKSGADALKQTGAAVCGW